MARLTAHERQGLSKSSFALPGKGKGPKGAGAGSFPIPDASHARNALARSANKSPEVKARVRAKVHAKYPGIGKAAGGRTICGEGEAPKASGGRARRK
jgi:hypothetical protein